MFKNIVSALSDISANIYFLRDEVKRLGGIPCDVTRSNDFHYIVEVEYKDHTMKSDPLFSLKGVNEFINFTVLVRQPSFIKILKIYDDGR